MNSSGRTKVFLCTRHALTTLTCLQRKESGRGVYKRTDFPDMNPEMNKPLVIWQEDGQFKFSWGAQ